MKREFNKLLLKPNIVSDSQLTKDEKVFEEDINLFNRWNSASHTLQMVSQTNQSTHGIPDETVKKKKSLNVTGSSSNAMQDYHSIMQTYSTSC